VTAFRALSVTRRLGVHGPYCWPINHVAGPLHRDCPTDHSTEDHIDPPCGFAAWTGDPQKEVRTGSTGHLQEKVPCSQSRATGGYAGKGVV